MIKRVISFLSAVTLVFSFTACVSRDMEEQAVQSGQTRSQTLEFLKR